MPIGKKIAPAIRKPQRPAAKQVKMCVSHAKKQSNAMIAPMFMPSSVRQMEPIHNAAMCAGHRYLLLVAKRNQDGRQG